MARDGETSNRGLSCDYCGHNGPSAPPDNGLTRPYHRDFVLAEDKSSGAGRHLAIDGEEIGLADVDAGDPRGSDGGPRNSNAELSIEVFRVVAGDCQEYNEDDCDESVSSTGEHEICELDDPLTGTRDYYVHYTYTGGRGLDFVTWTPDA